MKKVIFLLMVGLFSCSSHGEGYIEKFYNRAGAMTHNTPAGLYTSGTSGTLTGGSFLMKVPRKTFTPYSIQAPHLKAGCGGIDLFLGAFSIPSKEEFVSFVRSIGTAMPGLAFSIALQTMAPDLNEQVAQFRDMLMHLSENLGDSCQASEAILDQTGAKAWLTTMSHRAQNHLRASGQAEDQAEAKRLTAIDGGRVISSVPTKRNQAGHIVEATELNLTWSLLKGVKSSTPLTDNDREILMSLVGTVIYRQYGHGEDASIEEVPLPPLPILDALLTTDIYQKKATIERYACDEYEKCLTVRKVKQEDINLTRKIYDALVAYRTSILERNPNLVKPETLALLENISPMPLLQLAEIGASSRMEAFSGQYFLAYSEAAAYEVILAVLEAMTENISTVVMGSSSRHVNVQTERHAQILEARIEIIKAGLRSRQSELGAQLSRVNLIAQSWEQLAKQVRGVPAVELLNHLSGQ